LVIKQPTKTWRINKSRHKASHWSAGQSNERSRITT